MVDIQPIHPPMIEVPLGLMPERPSVRKLPLPPQSRDLSASTVRSKLPAIDVSVPAPGQPGSMFNPVVVSREEQAARRKGDQKRTVPAQNRGGSQRAEQTAQREQPRIPVSEMSFDDRLREERRARKAVSSGRESAGTRMMNGLMAGVSQAHGKASGDPVGPGEPSTRQEVSPAAATEVDAAGGHQQLKQLSGDDQLRLQGAMLAFHAIQGRAVSQVEQGVFRQALQGGVDGFTTSVRRQMGWEQSSRKEIAQLMSGSAAQTNEPEQSGSHPQAAEVYRRFPELNPMSRPEPTQEGPQQHRLER